MNSYNNFIGKDEKIIPKIEIQNEENVDRLTSEDGWELVDQVPDKIFKDVILGKMGKAVINDNIKMGFFKMFKEKKIDFLFNETYCKYFDFYLLPELSTSTLFNVKICDIFFNTSSFSFLIQTTIKQMNFGSTIK